MRRFAHEGIANTTSRKEGLMTCLSQSVNDLACDGLHHESTVAGNAVLFYCGAGADG